MVSRSKPTLANPTLAKVKVSVACKDFGFWELIVQVFFVCVELSGGGSKGGCQKGPPEKVGARRVGAKSGSRKGGGPKGGGPKISRFFFLSRPIFALFVSLWGSSRGFLVVFEAPGRSNVHVWSSRAVV